MAGFTTTLHGLDDTEKLGQALAVSLGPGRVVALSGPLGAGKSELARQIIRQLCPGQDDIPSPTFTLVQSYLTAPGFEIWHLDLYRLTHPDEVWALGIEEAFQGCLCLIEWPERIAGLMPSDTVYLNIEPDGDDEDRRQVSLSCTSDITPLRNACSEAGLSG